ncbi:MAG: 3-oxoacyl-ACP reductase FabG [Oscillospiraceae bacterium]|nr:3-oxoacyl-ACP reductase FabG [Oscillospiraceae bacterium]
MHGFGMDDKIAVITGAAQGIGRAIAQAFAESGALPVVVDINESAAKNAAEELSATTGKEPAWYAADLTDVAAVKQMVGDIVKQHGQVDVLVNNAGILDNSLIEELDEDHWDKVIDCNLKSAFFCSKYVYEHMKAAGKGHIVNVASVAGRMGGHSVGCAYAASKGGMIGLTMNFARKAAPFGVCVNAIAPGTVESGMALDFTPEQTERLHAAIPTRRFGKLSEIASATLFLGSDASSYMCGAVLDVNGGMHMG